MKKRSTEYTVEEKEKIKAFMGRMDEDYVRGRDGNVVTFTLTSFFESSKGRKYAATDFEGTGGHCIAFPVDIFSKEKLEDESDIMAAPVNNMEKNNRLVSDDHVRFRGIIDRMYDTFKQKNADYGSSFRELYKECGMTYAFGHMREKLERVRSLMKDEAQVKGESMKDSLYDLANYAVLTIMEMERSEHEGEESPSHKDKDD